MTMVKKGLVRTAAVLVAGVVFGVATSTFAASQADDSATIKLVHPGTLTMCTHLPYKPFEFVNKDREVVGFDVALGKLLAKDLGVDTQVVSIGWNQIVSGAVFAARKCDIAMGGATITAKRKESVQFSDPYFNATQVLLTKKDSGISSLADLKGKRLGVQTATTGQVYAEKHADDNGYTMVVYDDLALLTTAVSSGAVAASIQDSAPLIKYTQEHPDTVIAAAFDTGEHYGFMAKKDDANANRLIAKFNTALANAQEDGTYKKLYEKWFGKMPPATE